MQRVSIPFLALIRHDALLIVDTIDSSTTTGTLPELYTPFLKTPIILTGSLICFCRGGHLQEGCIEQIPHKHKGHLA